jgi:hypothetical protein
MRFVSTKMRTGRVVVAILLPIMLVVGILTAWRCGYFGGLNGAVDEGLIVSDAYNGEMRDMAGVGEGAGATDTGTAEAGRSHAQTREELDGGALCPVPLPSDYRAVAYNRGIAIERWQTSSDASCSDAARELLLILQEEGFELVKAGYLDVAGETWGCTVKTQEAESLVISLVPEVLGALRNEQNRLTLTIVRIAHPAITGITEDAS